jgi:hypothetical protein
MNDYGEMFYGTLPPDTQDFRQVLSGIGKMLRDRALAAGERIGQSGQEAIALQNQIFGDPNRPLRVTDERALARLTDMIMGGPLGFAPAGITAYHGSPYLFRQFDPAKIGAGEGAQAYGVGAGYTAEARPVAEGYKKTLSKDTFLSPNQSVITRNTLRDLGFDNSSINVVLNAIKESNGDFSKAAELVGSARPSAAKFLRSLSGAKQNEGYLYKGDIPDEILPKFLDWDKPLFEQSKEVKEALAKLPHRSSGLFNPEARWTFKDTIESLEAAPHLRTDSEMNPTGQEIYNMLGSSMMTGNRASGQLEATQKLNDLGIRGIKYADEASRGKYRAQTTYKGEPYSDVLTFYDKKQLDDFIKEKKAEGFGVKTFPRTSNFIPFRPEDYKVQEINDIPIEDWISKGLLGP